MSIPEAATVCSLEDAELQTVVLSALRGATTIPCPLAKQQLLQQLEQLQTRPGFLRCLLSIIDVRNTGTATVTVTVTDTVTVTKRGQGHSWHSNRDSRTDRDTEADRSVTDVRTLAVCMLKTFVEKQMNSRKSCYTVPQTSDQHMDVGSSSTHSPTEYRISSEEMALLRSFLCEYQVEPEYRIAIHLAVLAGKLARVDIHKEWPHLIPSLLKTIQTDGDPHCLRSVRALTTLQQVVQELSAINSACGKKLYGQICLQLFSDVAKVWAVQLKFLQSYISSCKLDQGTATLVGAVNNAVELQDFHVECTIVTCMLTTTVLNRVLERAFEELVAKSSDKFEKFLKTYIGAMQMLCKFIRSVRPLCQSLLNAYQSNEKGCLKSSCSSPFAHLKRLFDVENCEDDSADLDENYYIPDRFLLYLASMRSPSLLVFRCTNLVLRLLKRLSGLPVLLQKKYPLAVAPHLTPLLLYYYHQLIEEHTASIRPVVDNDAPVSVESAAVLGMNEAEVRAYRMCLSSPVLSLKCIILSATLFISNVLACNCYDAYNLVRRISAVTDPNEEGEVDGGNGLYMEEEAETNPTLTAAHHSRNNFFSSERVSTIINCMLDTTLRLTPQDLELWASDPEEFVHAEDAIATGDHYHGVTSLKLASHQLLCNLAESYAELVGDMFLALLSDHARQLRAISVFISSSTDPLVAKVMQNEILLWDAIYTCVGLVNKTVAARIPSACSWLGSSLGPLLSQVIKSSAAGAINGAQVLRGKMVWMLGRWLGIFHPRFRHCGLDFLVRVISNSDPQTASGVVVKINAVKALHSLINLPDYELSELMPVLLQLIDSLCTLVHQCQDSECKALVLEEIGDLLMLLGTEICQTLVRPIAEYLSRLWEQTAANDPVRSAIVEVLQHVVTVGKESSPSLHFYIVPIVRQATCCQTSSFLLKDGLVLWLTLMRNLPTSYYSPELDDLFATSYAKLFAVDFLAGCTSEPVLVQLVLWILESYVVYGSKGFIVDHQLLLATMFTQLVGKVPATLGSAAVRPIEVMLIVCPTIAAEFLIQSGVLGTMLKVCLSAVDCCNLRCLTSEWCTTDSIYISYLSVICQLVLHAPVTFMVSLSLLKVQILNYVFTMQGCVRDHNLTECVLFGQLIQLTIRLFPKLGSSMAATYRRKLWTVALLSVYPNGTEKAATIREKFRRLFRKDSGNSSSSSYSNSYSYSNSSMYNNSNSNSNSVCSLGLSTGNWGGSSKSGFFAGRGRASSVASQAALDTATESPCMIGRMLSFWSRNSASNSVPSANGTVQDFEDDAQSQSSFTTMSSRLTTPSTNTNLVNSASTSSFSPATMAMGSSTNSGKHNSCCDINPIRNLDDIRLIKINLNSSSSTISPVLIQKAVDLEQLCQWIVDVIRMEHSVRQESNKNSNYAKKLLVSTLKLVHIDLNSVRHSDSNSLGEAINYYDSDVESEIVNSSTVSDSLGNATDTSHAVDSNSYSYSYSHSHSNSALSPSALGMVLDPMAGYFCQFCLTDTINKCRETQIVLMQKVDALKLRVGPDLQEKLDSLLFAYK